MIKLIIYSVIIIAVLIALVKFGLLTIEQVTGILYMIGDVVKMIGKVIIERIISVIKIV